MGQVVPTSTNVEQTAEEPDIKVESLAVNDNKKSVFGTPQTERNFEANIPRLCFFTLVIGLGNIQAGFAISGNN